MAKGKIGEGHVEGMARQGLKELRGAFYPGSNIAQPTDYGIYGVETPGEIADARREQPPVDMEEEKAKSPLQESLKLSKAASRDKDNKDRGLER